MKRIISILMALVLVFALAACDSGSKPAANNTGSGGGNGSGGSNAAQPSGPDRYFKYVGGESLKDETKLVVPTVGYNGSSFEYPHFIEVFRYCKYVMLHADGSGILVEEGDGSNYEKLVFTFSEKEIVVDEKERMAQVGKDFFRCYVDDLGNLHLECREGMEVYIPVSKEEIDALHDGRVGYRDVNTASIGDAVVFGRYEQDTCQTNGPDPIVWTVLDKQGSKVLLLSNDVIDDHAFNNQAGDTAWESSSLRAFLNGDFYNAVFTAEEKQAIAVTKLENESHADYFAGYWKAGAAHINYGGIASVSSGGATEDRVFVLDAEELMYYLGKEDGYYPTFASAANGPADWLSTWEPFGIDFSYAAGGRIARPSQAIVKWSSVGFSKYHQSSTRHYANYWTRTMGDSQSAALAITDIGAFVPFPAASSNVGVRPCIWVETDASKAKAEVPASSVYTGPRQ